MVCVYKRDEIKIKGKIETSGEERWEEEANWVGEFSGLT